MAVLLARGGDRHDVVGLISSSQEVDIGNARRDSMEPPGGPDRVRAEDLQAADTDGAAPSRFFTHVSREVAPVVPAVILDQERPAGSMAHRTTRIGRFSGYLGRGST